MRDVAVAHATGAPHRRPLAPADEDRRSAGLEGLRVDRDGTEFEVLAAVLDAVLADDAGEAAVGRIAQLGTLQLLHAGKGLEVGARVLSVSVSI